jgi:uncharacterized membrane protein (UPF0127 family)
LTTNETLAAAAGAAPPRARVVELVKDDAGTVVCERCTLADNPLTRLKGLLGRRGLPAGEGLLLRPTGAVHTLFMRFPIDVVFLDTELRVIDVVAELRPWRAAGRRGTRAVLELAAGECGRRGIRAGDRLRVADAGRR